MNIIIIGLKKNISVLILFFYSLFSGGVLVEASRVVLLSFFFRLLEFIDVR